MSEINRLFEARESGLAGIRAKTAVNLKLLTGAEALDIDARQTAAGGSPGRL